MTASPVPEARRGAGRPRRLSLDLIIRAACEIGLENLDMAALAERLNTGVATLYGYVRSREHLLELVVDRLASEAHDDFSARSWQDVLEQHAEVSFRTTSTMPHLIIGLMSMEPGVDESEYGEKIIAQLVGFGMSPDQAAQAYAEVSQAVIGAAICHIRARRLAKVRGDGAMPTTGLGDFRPTLRWIVAGWERRLGSA